MNLFGNALHDIGVEFALDLLGLNFGGQVDVIDTDFNLIASMPAEFIGQSVEMVIPLSVLDNDDGNIDITMVLGNLTGPTDFAPDEGHGTVEAGRVWLSVEPAFGSVAPGGNLPAVVTFNAFGLQPGIYTAEIVIFNDDPNGNPTVVTATLTVVAPQPPDISVAPLSFAVTLAANETTVDTLVVTNTGPGTLDFDIDVVDTTPGLPAGASVPSPTPAVAVPSVAFSQASPRYPSPSVENGSDGDRAGQPAVAPPNDGFPGQVISAVPFQGSGNNFDATAEAGEQRPCDMSSNTIWFNFTPTRDMLLVADTFGSSFDTVMAAYTGSSLFSLEVLACNDQAQRSNQSRVAVQAVAGQTYYFQVGGWAFDSSTGFITFHLAETTAPDNDDFPGQTITALPFDGTGTTVGAFMEAGEQDPCGVIGSTVWFSFTPGRDMLLVADTFGSDFNTAMSVYVGGALPTLAHVECSAFGLLGDGAQIAFQATAGQTLHFQVGGAFEDSGTLVFHLREPIIEGVQVLANDLFAVVDNNSIWRVDSVSGEITEIPTPELASLNADGLAASADFLFFISGWESNAVYKMTHDGQVLDIFNIAAGAIDRLAYNDGKLYALDGESQRLLILDPNTGEVLGNVQTDVDFMGGMAPGPGGTLYVGNAFPPAVVQLDPTTGAVIAPVIGAESPVLGLAYDGELLVVGSTVGNHMVVDPASGQVVGQITGLPGVSALAIPFGRPWLTVDPRSGSVAPGASLPVTVTFDATDLDPGTYMADILVYSNDPDESPTLVKATLNVSAPGPTMSVTDVVVNEDAGSAAVVVTLSPASTALVTFNYATADGTATAGVDYVPVSGPMSFAPGETSKTLVVPIVNDALVEGNETFTFSISNAGGAAISRGTATVTIVDDDVPAGPTLSVADVAVNENAGSVAVRVSITPAAGGPVSFNYATGDGTAIAVGATFADINVVINDDTLVEGDETFTFILSNPTGGATIAAGVATVTILDDDPVGPVPPSFDPALQVQLNAAVIVVTWASANVEDGAVEWALSAADLASAPNVTTDFRGDLAARLNKRTHRIEITGVAGGSTIHFNIISGGLTHPDGPFQVTMPSVPLSAAPVGITGSISYQDGSPGRECLVYILVEHNFLNIVLLKSLPINAMTDGGDFAADIKNIRLADTPDNPLNFELNSQNSTIIVKAMCDARNVGEISSTTGDADKLLVGATVAEYQNMDIAVSEPLTVSIGDTSVVESFGPATLTVSLSSPAAANVTVDYATADGTATAGADYTTTSGTLTIPAGSTSGTISVPIIDDEVTEGDEAFTVNLGNPTGGATIAGGSAKVSILDDDDVTDAELTAAEVTVGEGDGSASVTISLASASAVAVSVDYVTVDGTATAPGDYTATSGTATIPAGSTSSFDFSSFETPCFALFSPRFVAKPASTH